MPSSRRQRAQPAEQLAAADMLEPPMQIGGQQRQRLEQDVVALLLDGAADAEHDDRRAGIRAVALRALAGERAEARRGRGRDS